MQETDKRVAHYARQIGVTNYHMSELELRNNQNAMKLDRMMEEKDRLIEEHNGSMYRYFDLAHVFTSYSMLTTK